MDNTSQNYVLHNVRVFDGDRVCEPSTINISDGYIVANGIDGAQVINCNNDILMPGFIDAHVHLEYEDALKTLSSYGVTTALDMGCWPLSRIERLRSHPHLTDIRTAGFMAVAPGSDHSGIPGIPDDAIVSTVQQARAFVAQRIVDKLDYIKIVVDSAGPAPEVLDALVTTSREHGMLTIAHATNNPTFAAAQKAGVDIITHVPTNSVLDKKIVRNMKAAGTIAVPTLTMMEGMTKKRLFHCASFKHASDSVTALYKAGIPILVGTDSNSQPFIPFSPPFGESMHHEMELMVKAGMSNIEVLRAATSEAARVFGLSDRGVVEVGRRADLVLLGGDPTRDIKETRSVKKVWCKGVEVEVFKA